MKMDESYSEGDLSMSPSQILGRLQVLRQLQLLQRGKLQKQQSLYQDSPEMSANLTEIVSHFSNSTSYNTFQNLLQTHENSSNETTPRPYISNSSKKLIEHDLIDGVSELNLSRESEFLINSPASIKSKVLSENKLTNNSKRKSLPNKQISLDEIPILTPKKNFEALVAEKLQTDENMKENKVKQKAIPTECGKKPFLKRGEGMSRFGIQKKDLIIQHTKSLPWLRKVPERKSENIQVNRKRKESETNNLEKVDVQIILSKPSSPETRKIIVNKIKEPEKCLEQPIIKETNQSNESSNFKSPISKISQKLISLPKGKHPLEANKGNTWAAVLTKEQDDFLRQLKQSEYYKNFASPTKSIISEMSYDDNMDKIQQDKESSEQKMFELLENKVTHESFNFENSFINRFLQRNIAECSGESTPLVMQKCLSNNPDIMRINPNLRHERGGNDECDEGTCQSECTECAETRSSISSCCSCFTVEPINTSCACDTEGKPNHKRQNGKGNTHKTKKVNPENVSGMQDKSDVKSHNDNPTNDSNKIKADMVEMNNKLIATSELLKERLSELEDEIETFRKENTNLTKMREEIDLERQKFFEEKAEFEQKFNEEKVLSEYYIAEEKEKLTKQRQLYERYVRDMRGRLNKKDKDEVVNLKKEINDLKEDIRIKDAKSTSMIARLRNQLKIMEKEKKYLQEEVEKLKKENRRIQHSNDVTRRLTNLKYLEQINKKLTNITKDSKSEVHIEPNIKYKAFEIERQSRIRSVQPQNKGIRPRAKSVPNLNITSRYAKYFSQKDSLSEIDRNKTSNVDDFCTSPPDYMTDHHKIDNLYDSNSEKSATESEEENNLEKMYDKKFRSSAPTSKKYSSTNSSDNSNSNDNNNSYFIHKSNLSQQSLPIHQTKLNDKISLATTATNLSHRVTRNSPTSYLRNSCESGERNMSNCSKESGKISGYNAHGLTKSPTSTISNYSSNKRMDTVIDQFQDTRIIVTPEPCTSRSSLSKTNLNPTEITKPDGSRELRFPNGNIKFISADGKYSKFVYYNGDVKENFYGEGRMKYFYAETKTFQTTHADGLEILEFPDGQVEKRYKDGSSEIRLPNGSVRYFDPKNIHVREEWRFPDGAALTVAANGEQRVAFSNGQIEVHTKDHKRREFPDGTVKFIYNDGTSETRYASGRVRIKDKHGNLIMDSAPS